MLYMLSAPLTNAPTTTTFLDLCEKVRQVGSMFPAWYQDYEDFGHDPAELGRLLATAPHPFLAAVVYGRQAAAL